MLASYGKFEDERPFTFHSVLEQGVQALTYGCPVGFTPRLQACQGARLH